MKSLFALLFTFTLLSAQGYEYVVPEKVLQTRLAESFPITKQTLFVTIKISDPQLILDGKKQRFNMKAKLQIPNIQDTSGKVVSAKVSISSRIAYSKGGRLYLRKIKVVKIESPYISKDMEGMLYSTMNKALNEYFKDEPIYNLEHEKGLIGAAVQSIKSVKIVDKGIKIIFDLGV